MYFRILGFRFILLWLAIVFNLIVFTLLLNFHIQNVSTCGSLTRKIQ
jgi:hypothetical protein